MSTDRDVNRIVRSWLNEERHEDADPVLNRVLSDVDTTPQRRSSWSVWRFAQMNNPLRTALAASAVVGVALIGYQAFLAPDVGSPNQTPVPSASPAASVPPTATVGLLEPGSYRTGTFRPAVTFTVPQGWEYVSETENTFEIVPATDVASNLQIYHGPMPQPSDDENNVVPGVGTSLLEVMTFVAERPDLEVTQPPTEWVLGGLNGYWMEIANPGTTELVVFKDGQNLYGGGQNRFGFLEMPDGSAIHVTVFTFEGTEAYLEATTSIIETFVFDLE